MSPQKQDLFKQSLGTEVGKGESTVRDGRNIPFKDDEEFKLFIRRAIYFKGNSMNGITRNKILSLIYNYGKKSEDLGKILPEILSQVAEINLGDKIVKGRIVTKGDGIRGLRGNGPIKFYFHAIA